MSALDTAAASGHGFRPSIHFTPARNWMNDPNGLVFHDGNYHLFFQYNPNGSSHGDISWGHAISPDLVHWEELPLAISFDAHEQIFSGSAVVDETNSSGLGDGDTAPMVAIYTSARSDGIQAQSLAYSQDGGTTWQKYAGNPVLDRGSADFRDPKVFRYSGDAGEFWVMVAVEAAQQQVLLHRSEDLTHWTYLSSYGPAGATGGVWECPDFFPLPVDGDTNDVRWVLLISLNPGGVAGGSGTQYIIGSFDGKTFFPDHEWPVTGAADPALGELDWLDFGRDCYAGVSFNGLPDSDRTLIAWMNNWDYAGDVPTAPWKGSMTLARRLALVTRDGRPQLRVEPILPPATTITRLEDVAPEDSPRLPPVPVPGRVTVDLGVDVGVEAAPIDLVFSDGEASVTVTLDPAGRTVQVNRSQSSRTNFNDSFASVEVMHVPEGSMSEIAIIIDHGSLEIFTADGLRSLSDLVFLEGNMSLTVATPTGGRIATLAIETLSRRSL